MAISLRAMRYFNTAVEQGSLSLAAGELNIAASAISAAIDQVEEHFQMKLVNRIRSRGITPTVNGKEIRRKFSRLLEDYEAIMAEGLEMQDAMQGELRIGYYAPVAPAFLPFILSDFIGKDSRITLQIEECDNVRAQEGFLAGDFDVILFVSDNAMPQVDFDVLIEAPAYCLMSNTHTLTAQQMVSLDDVSDYHLIVLNRPVATEYYRKLFENRRDTPIRSTFSNSTEMVRSLVSSGDGLAILNMLPATDVSYAGNRLTARAISDDLPALTVSVGYEQTKPRRLVKKFVDLCKSYFELEGKKHVLGARIARQVGRDD